MKTPLQIITEYGCPTDSFVAAMQYFGNREDLTHEQYLKGIQDLIALPDLPTIESYHFSKVLFLYIIQETIRAYILGIIPIMDDIYTLSIKKTQKHIEDNPWSVTRFNINHGLQEHEEIDPETGAILPVKSKGAKKDVTERIFNELKSKGASRQDIIDQFVQQTGMSKAGATTYFHALKKELGFVENESANTKTPKQESKQEIANRLYQESSDKSKSTMIALFIETLETSKLGAQTYYYTCKKKFNDTSILPTI